MKDAENPSNQYVIKEILVDVVYGKMADGCDIDNHYQLKTSLTWLQDSEDKLAYKRVGAPGYQKGLPILIGNEIKDQLTNTVDGTTTDIRLFTANQNGYTFRGSDQYGQCFWMKDANYEYQGASTYTPGEFLINDIGEKMYFEDPLFTFEDDMMFGCSLRFTADELKSFCESKGWTNLVLLQNIYNMKWFGKSANADPHYPSDWAEVEIDGSDKFGDQGTWSDQNKQCELPSLHVIEVYYQKVNTLEDP